MSIHPVTRYALDAVERKIVVGQTERLACIRHLYDLARAGQLAPDLAVRVQKSTKKPVPKRIPAYPWRFDEEQATFVAIEWFKHLRHVEGRLADEPIELIPAHIFDVGCIFGWVTRQPKITRSNGRKVGARRFRKAFITEARKNAKTTRLAGVSLYLMVGDSEESPKVYPAAVDRGQARELYDAAKKMGEKSPDISKRLHIRDYKITHRTRGGKMAPLSKETKNKDGLNPSGAVIDEYHAHPTSEIYDLISSAKGQRMQPLMGIITTAGMDTESPCHKEYEYCKLILSEQVENDRYFVMIRELDKGDDEHNSKNWVKANPLLVSTPEGFAELRDMHDEAFGSMDPAKIRTFRVKNLNIWVHGNENSFMGEYMEKWDELAIPREEFAELTKGRLALVGCDLSKKIDLTADAFIFALDKERVALCAHGFMPEAAVKRHEKTDKIPYGDWARAGWLTLTEGDVTDYAKVQAHIQDAEMDQSLKVHELLYDPYNATHFASEMTGLGYTTVEIRQTMANLSEATKLIRDLVASGKLVHDGSPLLRWCVGNAMQIVDSKENVMISKKNAADTRRVDLLTAGITALTGLPRLRDATSFEDFLKSDEFGF